MTFLETPYFKRHFIEYVHPVTLLVLRRVRKPWQRVAESYIKKLREQGVLVLHRGEGTSKEVADSNARKKNMKLVTQVIFLQNVTRIGLNSFVYARNRVVIDIPEGVVSIGVQAFCICRSLTVSFPTTLKSIGEAAFANFFSLDNIDLLHTSLQELGKGAFMQCSELNLMTIPDSLQKLGGGVFHKCPKLAPSYIDVSNASKDTTSEVLKYLHDHMVKDIASLQVKFTEQGVQNE